MLFSENVPHSGQDEEDHIDALETVRATLIEGRKAGAVDFFIGVDINIELRLGNAGEDLHGFASIEWCGQYGPECEDGGEDVITYEKEIRWLPSTWTNSENEANRQHHTWQAWCSRVCKTTRLHYGAEGYSLNNLVCDCQDRGERPEDEEGSERLGGLDPCI